MLALTVIKNVQHECGHQGCNVKLNFGEIKEHEEKCIWRLIPCPGMGINCTAKTPLCNVVNHAEVCPDCNWPPIQVDGEEALFTNLLRVTKWGVREDFARKPKFWSLRKGCFSLSDLLGKRVDSKLRF